MNLAFRNILAVRRLRRTSVHHGTERTTSVRSSRGISTPTRGETCLQSSPEVVSGVIDFPHRIVDAHRRAGWLADLGEDGLGPRFCGLLVENR
ncbi:unnamed protein product [Lasius platythorax]|uniref:Uncharacterized protein n=1 Tax=Lasius platythorax TaxID=488582 RepID=A0AAV2NR18_9HYME